MPGANLVETPRETARDPLSSMASKYPALQSGVEEDSSQPTSQQHVNKKAPVKTGALK